jgi:hypothetical protein
MCEERVDRRFVTSTSSWKMDCVVSDSCFGEKKRNGLANRTSQLSFAKLDQVMIYSSQIEVIALNGDRETSLADV